MLSCKIVAPLVIWCSYFYPWSLANSDGSCWLSYSGVVGVLFPEQLRAVAERLCRCNIVHPVSILEVSMCAAGICPSVHRRFSDFRLCFIFFKLKRNRAALSGSSSEKKNIVSVKWAFWRRVYWSVWSITAASWTGVWQRNERIDAKFQPKLHIFFAMVLRLSEQFIYTSDADENLYHNAVCVIFWERNDPTAAKTISTFWGLVL